MEKQLRIALEMKRNFYIKNLMASGKYEDKQILRGLSFRDLQREYSLLMNSQSEKTSRLRFN